MMRTMPCFFFVWTFFSGGGVCVEFDVVRLILAHFDNVFPPHVDLVLHCPGVLTIGRHAKNGSMDFQQTTKNHISLSLTILCAALQVNGFALVRNIHLHVDTQPNLSLDGSTTGPKAELLNQVNISLHCTSTVMSPYSALLFPHCSRHLPNTHHSS